MNNAERLWSMLQAIWSKAIASIRTYDLNNLETDIKICMMEVSLNVTTRMLFANQKYFDIAMQGTLI